MISINVIDFDKTLIPFDSFRAFVLKEIRRFRLSFLLISVLRFIRIINAGTYKRLIINIVLKSSFDSFRLESFCDDLFGNIDSHVSDIIKEKTDNNTINILCSASPDFYISAIASKLGWKGYGSHINDDGQFLHLYGSNKKEFILKYFPKSEYNYKFSISDSKSDLSLLELFEEYNLIE